METSRKGLSRKGLSRKGLSRKGLSRKGLSHKEINRVINRIHKVSRRVNKVRMGTKVNQKERHQKLLIINCLKGHLM
jgi:SOS response regulatory protein OraA/RecX